MTGLGVGPGGYGACLRCFSRKSLYETARDTMKIRGTDSACSSIIDSWVSSRAGGLGTVDLTDDGEEQSDVFPAMGCSHDG